MTCEGAGGVNASEDRRFASLMQRTQAGDRIAYRILLNDCEPTIRRVALANGLIGNDLDDAIRATLITFHDARQTYHPSGSFTAWLTVIANHRSLEVLRASGRRERRKQVERGGYGLSPSLSEKIWIDVPPTKDAPC